MEGNAMEGLQTESYWYLATPYSNYPFGRETAFRHACSAAARLNVYGVHIYSPIAHGHPISEYGGLDPLDHKPWMTLDRKMMEAAHGLIVVMMPGWDESKGVNIEISDFVNSGKPIAYLNWPEITIVENGHADK